MFSLHLLPLWFMIIFFFVLGCLLGSFANVLIFRIPENLSVIKPRSRCRQCGYQLKWYENVPVFSYLVLMGKCSACKQSISWRYPLVEVLMGAGFAGLYWWHGPSIYLIEHLIFYFGLIVVTFIDFDHMILPDSFTLSGIVLGLLGSFINDGRTFIDSLLGVIFGGGFLWAVAYVYYVTRKQEGMGGGDIKLLAWIGAVLGWQSIPFVILISCIFGSIVGLLMAIRSNKGMQTVIPFGPYLALSAVLYIFGGSELGQMYINLFLPGLV